MGVNNNQQGIFYRIGRGVFLAWLVVAMPCLFVMAFYEKIDAVSDDLSELPVFEDLHGNFRTGLQMAGEHFRRESTRFYDSDTLPSVASLSSEDLYSAEKEPLVSRRRIVWDGDWLEQALLDELPARKHEHVRAYFAYLREFKGMALSEMRRSKIPASVTLAQGLLESDAGRSFLANRAYNHFGIKCLQRPGARRDGQITDADYGHHGLAIDCIQRHDDHAWDRFEVYPAPDASFRRHSLLLLGERYNWMIRRYPVGKICPLPKSFLGQTEAPYYVGWSLGLKSSGYATSKRYAEKIALIIETYQLWKIDYEALV